MAFYDAYARTLSPLLHLVSRFDVVGREHLPQSGPLIVACNHVHDLDSQYLGIALYPLHIHYMGKQELFKYKPIAAFLRQMKVYPVNRANPGPGFLKHTMAILKSGGVVGIFPEGTRSVEGGPLKTGAVRIALKAGAPILPAWYEGPTAWGDLLKRPRAIIRFGPMLRLDQYKGVPVTDELVGSLVAELGEAMGRLRDAGTGQ